VAWISFNFFAEYAIASSHETFVHSSSIDSRIIGES